MQLGTGSTFVNMDATYGWDNEGKLTSMTSPGGGIAGGTPSNYVYSLEGFTDAPILNDAYFLQNGLVNQSV